MSDINEETMKVQFTDEEILHLPARRVFVVNTPLPVKEVNLPLPVEEVDKSPRNVIIDNVPLPVSLQSPNQLHVVVDGGTVEVNNPGMELHSALFKVGKKYHIHTGYAGEDNWRVEWRVDEIRGNWMKCTEMPAGGGSGFPGGQIRFFNASQIYWCQQLF